MSAPFTDLMNQAAIAAADVILQVYNRDVVAMQKSDGSPVTEADHKAEAIILEYLARSGLPVLAEESVSGGHIPELGERYFVVDPLDGTKEFLKRNGEFTVNIAYCEGGRPVSGVVLAPVTGDIYWGGPDGAFAGKVVDGSIAEARKLGVSHVEQPLRIVASRSHGHPALAVVCDELAVAENVSVGSSLKFCLLAAGKAQLYPRFTPTSEWDTAAGQAVLQAAGGVVLDLDGLPLTCGHPDRKFLNTWFVAASSRDLALSALAHMVRFAET